MEFGFWGSYENFYVQCIMHDNCAFDQKQFAQKIIAKSRRFGIIMMPLS